MNLNKNQIEAIKNINGPVMVMAGAGSGKTRVLTNRFSNIVAQGVSPYEILAVTFTNKAAKEMKERISHGLKMSSDNFWISTFHAMCSKILRSDIDAIGYSKDFVILDSSDSVMIIKIILKEIDVDIKQFVPKRIFSMIGNIRYDMDNIEENIKKYDGQFHDVLRSVIRKYEAYKKRENLLDFQDLLIKTITLFESNKRILDKYSTRFKYIMVDEFQDTNNLQFRLLRLLTENHNNIFVVGDMDQSIYSFRGANIENINHFKSKYNPLVILLEENYRSTKNILKASNSVIEKNKNRIDKTLKTNNEEGNKVIHFKAPSSYDEVSFVKEQIQLLVRNDKKYQDIAILYRNNAMSRNFEEAFSSNRIPYKIHGGFSFFDRKEIKDLVAYLRIIMNSSDNFSLKRIINEPKRGIGGVSLDKIENNANDLDMTIYEYLNTDMKSIGKSLREKLSTFKNAIAFLKTKIETTEITDFIDLLLNKVEYIDMIKRLGEEGKVKIEYLNEFKSILFEIKNKYGDTYISNRQIIEEALENISLRNSTKEEESVDGFVTLMTIHSSKGLEFPFVFIVGFENGIFPSWRSLDDYNELEEERRLCYVAMTRAESILYITNCISRTQYGEIKNNPSSVFLHEIDKTAITSYGAVVKKPSSTQDIKRDYLHTKVMNYKCGDKVNHISFGDGVVVQVDGDFIKVGFEVQHGIKKIMKNHKSIKKI